MPINRKFRLKITLPVAVTGLISAAAALVIGVNQMNYARSMERMADRQMRRVAAETREELARFHFQATALMDQARKMLELQLLAVSSIESQFLVGGRLNPYFQSVMRQHPRLQNLYLGGADSEFAMLRRNGSDLEFRLRQKDGDHGFSSISYLLDESGLTHKASSFEAYKAFDPRQRPWYTAVEKRMNSSWTEVYRFFASDNLGITISVPLRVEDELVAVLGFDYEIDSLSTFLQELVRKDHGSAFLVDEEGRLVAHSTKSLLAIDNQNGEQEIPRAAHSSDLPTRKVVAASAEEAIESGSVFSTTIEANREDLLVEVSPLPWRDCAEWRLAVVIPKSVFMGDVQKSNRMVVVASLIGILLCIVGGLRVSELICGPINQLRLETERIREFNLDYDERVESVFLEVDRIADSIDRMRSGLRSFAKYVPADLVRQLIAAHADARRGGEERELTVMFTDIAGFTRFSETVDSDELVLFLGDYLTELANVIQETGGTIDKFIGDSILAFWNAPLNRPNHAILACEAAMGCRNRLSELASQWNERGFTAIGTRIGIHTGKVTVGNIGSEKRMEYTVIGDNVNLANRIEALGKYYGSDIIVSEATVKQLDGRFVVRKLDEVVAVGKTQSVAVFEIVGRQGDVAKEAIVFIEKYEEGLAAYYRQDWQESERCFSEAMAMKPDDQATHNLQIRCLEGRASSGTPAWTAAYRATTK